MIDVVFTRMYSTNIESKVAENEAAFNYYFLTYHRRVLATFERLSYFVEVV